MVMCGVMAPKKPSLPIQVDEGDEQWPKCPECGRKLISLGWENAGRFSNPRNPPADIKKYPEDSYNF